MIEIKVGKNLNSFVILDHILQPAIFLSLPALQY